MPDEDLLSGLPLELQMHVADAVGERCDRAALALASPRLLGLAACRGLRSYQGLEMSLAFHHVLGGAIDEQLLRSYASRAEATLEGCGWLTGVAAAAGLRRLHLAGPGSVREAEQVSHHSIRPVRRYITPLPHCSCALDTTWVAGHI